MNPGADLCFWCDKPGKLRWDRDRESPVHLACAKYLRERGREVRLGKVGDDPKPLPGRARHAKFPKKRLKA